MSGSMFVYEPIAPCLTGSQNARQSLELDNLAGKTIAFIDNSKPNFRYLVEDLARMLMEKHGVKQVLTRRKRSASIGLADNQLDELASEADAVITGSGD